MGALTCLVRRMPVLRSPAQATDGRFQSCTGLCMCAKARMTQGIEVEPSVREPRAIGAERTAVDVHQPPPCMNRIQRCGSPRLRKYPPGEPSKQTAPCLAASVSITLSHDAAADLDASARTTPPSISTTTPANAPISTQLGNPRPTRHRRQAPADGVRARAAHARVLLF